MRKQVVFVLSATVLVAALAAPALAQAPAAQAAGPWRLVERVLSALAELGSAFAVGTPPAGLTAEGDPNGTAGQQLGGDPPTRMTAAVDPFG